MMLVYHVTEAGNARSILRQGFLPGWGDAGLGVYVFDDALAALEYAAQGGWDGSLTDTVVLEIETTPEDVEPVFPDPAWPDPETYERVLWHPTDDEAVFWRPASVKVLEDQTPSP